MNDSPELTGALQPDANAHPDFVGNSAGVRPLAFADLVLETLQRERALRGPRAPRIGLHGDRYDDVPRDAFQRKLADDLVAIATEAPERRRGEMRDWKLYRIEPQRTTRFFLRIGAREIDAPEVDVDHGLCLVECGGLEDDVRFPRLEPAVEIDAHLLDRERDLAPGWNDRIGACNGRHQGCGTPGNEQQSRHHQRAVGSGRWNGSMRASTVSRST